MPSSVFPPRSAQAQAPDVAAPARLAAAIESVAAADPDRVAIVTAAGLGPDRRRAVSYGTLASDVAVMERRLAEAHPIGVIARSGEIAALVAIVAACGRQRVPLALVAEDSRDLVGELRDWSVCGDDLAVPSPPAQGRSRREYDSSSPQVVVATSGTSGPPKLVEHSWDSLLAAARLAEQWHGRGWILVYDGTRWAGTQVWLQAILTGGRLIVPASRDPDCVARAAADEDVSILPATPTLLRRVIASADSDAVGRMRLDRITLGGEAADGQLLEQARALFPTARVTHVYATTELGEVFRVSDGLPGFPAECSAGPCREGQNCRPAAMASSSFSSRATRLRWRPAISSSAVASGTNFPADAATRSSSAGPRSFLAGSRTFSAPCLVSLTRGPTASPARSPGRSSPRRLSPSIPSPRVSRRRISGPRRWRRAVRPSRHTACLVCSTSPGSCSRIHRARCREGRLADERAPIGAGQQPGPSHGRI